MADRWPRVPVSAVCDIRIGGTPRRAESSYWGGSVKWASAKDVASCTTRYLRATTDTITKKGLEASAAKLLGRDTIVITARGTVGALCMLAEPMSFNQTCYGLVARKEVVPDYLYYALKAVLSELHSLSYGTVFDTITTRSFDLLEIPLPCLEEQQAIACILGTLDDKIELNRRMNETLEGIAQAIFKSWFVDFDPVRTKAVGQQPPGLAPYIADLFPDELVDSELGEIPKGWEVGTLEDVIGIHDSKRIPLSKRERSERKGEYPYYGATGIMDYVDDFIFDGIYVLMAEDGSVVDDEGHPVLQYVWGQFWVNNHAHVLQGTGGVSTEQLLLALQRVRIDPFLTGAVQLKLNQRNMKSIPLVLAPEDVNMGFQNIVGSPFESIRSNVEESRTLTTLRDTLLPKLISGELRVPDAERVMEEGV